METDLLHHATSADVVLNVCEDGCFCGVDKLLYSNAYTQLLWYSCSSVCSQWEVVSAESVVQLI